MLQLKEITKTYVTGDMEVQALKGVSINFRKNEFVSILGPSGCGKTTTLNIIGGLDQATGGDLVINGESTKGFKDRDWDSYRNHTVGFVFQSYNLIPHQTVLANVEMALTLTGVGKAERKKRAKEALVKVGLDGQFYKRPSELSGGQMQRVAIARAIVNNPDIILADEPTGALDTVTSVQVMDILKEIAEDRLVIMVTHNPDLAEKYSTRIIRMLDGNVVDDTKPLSEAELKKELKEAEKARIDFKKKKPTMSFATSFMLSLKNLFTKKGRTILTSFAGSIGIIGIALIFAVSQGTTNYIAQIQEETLASYPLQIEKQHTDLSSMLTTYVENTEAKEQHENDAVYRKDVLYKLAYSLNNLETSDNDLKSFKAWIDAEMQKNGDFANAVNGIHYGYDITPVIYTENTEGVVIPADTGKLMQEVMSTIYGVDITSLSLTGGGLMSNLAYTSTSLTIWQELVPEKNGTGISPLITETYDCIYGSWPTKPNQVVLVVDGNNEIDDLTLYALGLVSEDEITSIIDAALAGEPDTVTRQHSSWSYEDVCNRTFRSIYNLECYKKVGNVWVNQLETLSSTALKAFYQSAEGVDITVSGVIRVKEGKTSILSGSLCYLSSFKNQVIAHAENSANTAGNALYDQLHSPLVDVFTDLPFKLGGNPQTADKASWLDNYKAVLTESQKAQLFVNMKCTPTDAEMQSAAMQKMQSYPTAESQRQFLKTMAQMQGGATAEMMLAYIDKMSDQEVQQMCFVALVEVATAEYQATQRVAVTSTFTTVEAQASEFEKFYATLSAEQKAFYYDKTLTFSQNSYDQNMATLGNVNLDSPSLIEFYAVSFADKDVIKDAIASYNAQNADKKIEYSDYVGLIMSSVTTIVDAVTYVLIAFVAISLIVSSIMIGVITLISVQERTKEIGILRAMGASKRDVSGMFNVETVIIGFTSGAFGVVITYLLCLPINAILRSLTGIASLKATLPIAVAVILIAISMLLTLVAGLIPSRSAAKKDPVVCLRTE